MNICMFLPMFFSNIEECNDNSEYYIHKDYEKCICGGHTLSYYAKFTQHNHPNVCFTKEEFERIHLLVHDIRFPNIFKYNNIYIIPETKEIWNFIINGGNIETLINS